METIYADIAARTGGNIYIGVVGPVRTGKSTLIKRIMEKLVIPAIPDPYRRERATDELPQSGSGKTIMTAEPKFVPEEAVEISPDGKTNIRIRLIDSVGYMIPGAVGVEEDGVPRMVSTPWYDHEIPMTDAAELGTKKVMQEHCSIGLVVTTDGSITDIPRADYLQAEAQAIGDMQKTGKPFLTIINSRHPQGKEALAVQQQLRDRYGIEAAVFDCQALEEADIAAMLQKLLYAFPLQELKVYLPRWLDALPKDDPIKASICTALMELADSIQALGQAEGVLSRLSQVEAVESWHMRSVDPSNGCVECAIDLPRQLFYNILSAKAGTQIDSDAQLLGLLTELSAIKLEYDKIADALSSVKATGYGVVMPRPEEMVLQTPQIIRKGGTFGVQLKAGAPSIHMIRVDIDTQISPMVGDENQSKELIAYLTDGDPEKLWESNIFGKSVYELIREGLSAKLVRLPEEIREKFRNILSRTVNEEANGLLCLIL